MKFVPGNKETIEFVLKNQLGKRIKALRKEQGLTQEAFAEAIEVHPSFVAPLEAGRKLPRLVTLAKIANALKISLYRLFMFEPDVTETQRILQELLDILKERPEHDAKILLGLVKDFARYYPLH